MNLAQAVAEFYRRCAPDQALEVDDERYVSLAEARGINWRQQLETALRRSDQPNVELLSGFSGDGKTTELRLLARDLSEGSPRLAVVYVDAERYVNRYSYRVIDVLTAIISETGRTLQDNFGIRLRPRYLAKRWHELKGMAFSDVELKELKLGARADPFEFGARLGLKVRNNDRLRSAVWSALDNDGTTLADEFARLLEEDARPRLRAHPDGPYADLVVLVDGLEKLQPDAGGRAYTDLFIHGASVIQQLGVRAVLTVPVGLAYSPDAGRLRDVYGTSPHVIPAARVPDFCGKHFSHGERDIAREKIRELVRLRLPPALGKRLGVAFDHEDTLNELIRFSGGHVRTLLILLRETANRRHAFPIRGEDVAETRKQWVQAVSRELRRSSQFEVAAYVHHHHWLPGDDEGLSVAMTMLQNLMMFAYHNDRECYEVRPALLGLQQVSDELERLRKKDKRR